MKGGDEMTDERAAQLLRPLRQEPEGASRVDVPRAMAEGRRRRVLRHWSGGVALVALTSVTAGGGTLAMSALREETPLPVPTAVVSLTPDIVPAAPAGPKDCQVRRLPTDGVRKALVTAGDPSGHYLAGRVYQSSISTVIWKDGKIVARPALSGEDPGFSDINRAGVAVGSAYVAEEQQQAYVYRNGRVTALNGRHTQAQAVNDAGVIVGSVGEVLKEVPARWTSADSPVTELPMPAGYTTGLAFAVAENGTVAGSISQGSTGVQTSYLWSPDGTGYEMPLPTVKGVKATAFWAESITDDWVAGRAVFDEKESGSRSFAPMRYRIDNRAYQELPVNSYPALVADNGWVLTGSMEVPSIVAGTRVTKLPRYGKSKEYQISSFSADGRTAAGYTTDTEGDRVGNEPLLWTCR